MSDEVDRLIERAERLAPRLRVAGVLTVAVLVAAGLIVVYLLG